MALNIVRLFRGGAGYRRHWNDIEEKWRYMDLFSDIAVFLFCFTGCGTDESQAAVS